MPGFILALVALAAAGCDSGNAKAKAKEIGGKVDHALDDLDRDAIAQRLADAKRDLASGGEPGEPCTWVVTAAADGVAAASQAAVTELRRLCSLDVPLGRATRAVTLAEAARAELPEAPSLTECSSDAWPKAKQRLDRDHANEPRWTELKARWAKVCPGG